METLEIRLTPTEQDRERFKDYKDWEKIFYTIQLHQNYEKIRKKLENHDFSKTIFTNIQNKGLLTRILEKLLKLKLNSNNRFWIYSCVETFLRGSNFKHQIFIIFSGVLYKLINDVMNI